MTVCLAGSLPHVHCYGKLVSVNCLRLPYGRCSGKAAWGTTSTESWAEQNGASGTAGRTRREPLAKETPTARHVGPPAEALPGLLGDLVVYINRFDGVPLLRAAVAHAQFEPIHPFPDGNGRTDRALIQFMLPRERIINRGTLPVSSALMLERPRYFDTLDAFRVVCAADDQARSAAARPWIEMLAEAICHACLLHDRLNSHVEALQQRWAAQAAAHRIRSSSAASRLLGHLPRHPVITAASARELLDTNERTARHAVARLAEAGILEQRSAGRRNRVFECGDMMDAFTESAREQPAANLTLSTPSNAPGPSVPTKNAPPGCDGCAAQGGSATV